jgi:hypothetical protein
MQTQGFGGKAGVSSTIKCKQSKESDSAKRMDQGKQREAETKANGGGRRRKREAGHPSGPRPWAPGYLQGLAAFPTPGVQETLPTNSPFLLKLIQEAFGLAA